MLIECSYCESKVDGEVLASHKEFYRDEPYFSRVGCAHPTPLGFGNTMKIQFNFPPFPKGGIKGDLKKMLVAPLKYFVGPPGVEK